MTAVCVLHGGALHHGSITHVDNTIVVAGQGVDQLAEVIRRIKSDPSDRRIILTAWNPAALKDMALPPCHMFCQVGN